MQRIVINDFILYLHSTWIIFWPDSDEFSQMMRPQNGAVSGKVVKIIHNDSHKQVEHDKGTQKDERNEVHVGYIGTTSLIWHENFT